MTSVSTSQTHEVRLAVYDLSRGMARTLSGQFLGPDHAIDIIPHTALIVYGREYFFGGGIQSTLPSDFRNSTQMFPIEQTLGYTSVSQAEFENWCTGKMQSGEWNAAAYDLLHRNCNNFSHDAALHGLRLSRGVPDWILQVPQTFLSSPMGQMIRPMLEQMQVTGTGNGNFGGTTGGGIAPFANAPTATTPPSPRAPVSTTTANPWASIPDQTNTDNINTGNSSSSSSSTMSQSQTKAKVKTPVLDSHNRPLLSSDTKAVGVCLSKLLEKITDETDQSMLKQVSVMLLAKKDASISQPIFEGSCRAIWNHLNSDEKVIGTTIVFTLMLLRLIALYPPNNDIKEEQNDDKSYFTKCIDWVEKHLAKDEDNGTKPICSSPAARSMLWCTASNAYGKDATCIKSVESAVEAAMVDLSPQSQSRVEVRQAAAAFVYNITNSPPQNRQYHTNAVEQQDELSDLTVSLLCGALDGITEEKDETVLLRRLLVAGKLIRSSNNNTSEGGDFSSPAKTLVVDLGFVDGLSSVISATGDESIENHSKKQSTKLAKELQSLVES